MELYASRSWLDTLQLHFRILEDIHYRSSFLQNPAVKKPCDCQVLYIVELVLQLQLRSTNITVYFSLARVPRKFYAA